MTDDTLSQFSRELNSYVVIVLLNIAFGALSMAFGMQFIVNSVQGLPGEQHALLRMFSGVFAMVCFGLGLAWVISSAKVLHGVTGLRREYKSRDDPVSPDVLTGWIIRTMAHYRENRATIRWMTFFCILGGCSFLLLGVQNIGQGISGLSEPGFTGMMVIPFLAAGINLAIGGVCLRCTWYFRKYTAAWDGRLAEAARSEETLQLAMERR